MCARERIKRNLVVITELRATLWRGRQDTTTWILITTAEHVHLFDARYTGCFYVTFNRVLLLPWSTCQRVLLNKSICNLLGTFLKIQQSLVLVSSVATMLLPLRASGNNKLANKLREVKQPAHLRAEAVAEWINKEV